MTTAVQRVDLVRVFGEAYHAAAEPALVTVPAMDFVMINGVGDPSGRRFRDAVAALYTIAYGVKFRLQDEIGVSHRVMPLEALWWPRSGRRWDEFDRDGWRWKAMIMQPRQTTQRLVDEARADGRTRRGASPLLGDVRLEIWDEGPCIQALHVGPYADEQQTIERIHRAVDQLGLRITGKHHEIYVSDPRRTDRARLRTIIRYPVSQP
jgi:hypothetical protein